MVCRFGDPEKKEKKSNARISKHRLEKKEKKNICDI